MFNWYTDAKICYAYLGDVKHSEDSEADAFAESRWFTRGWTLQELIAPRDLRFFDSKWTYIASRSDVVEVLASKTGIAQEVLNSDRPYLPGYLDEHSIARRLSWAANRQTTRPEDRAYSLLGLFGVTMPLLYGERHNAFRRLQEEVLKVKADLSILAWSWKSTRPPWMSVDRRSHLLASSPDQFADCGNITLTHESNTSIVEGETTLTNVALRVTARIIETNKDDPHDQRLAMVLKCRPSDDATKILALTLTLRPDYDTVEEALKRDVLECVCEDSLTRLIHVDALNASTASRVRTLAISLAKVVHPRSIAQAGWNGVFWLCSSVWIRFSDPMVERDWHMLECYPRKYWRANLTFDLGAAREDNKQTRLTSHSLINSEHGEIRGAVVLQYPELNVQRVLLSFSYAYSSSDSDYIYCYSLALYDGESAIPSNKLPKIPVHSLRINDYEILDARLHVADVFNEKVLILDLSVSTDAKATQLRKRLKTKVWSQVKARFRNAGPRARHPTIQITKRNLIEA